MNAALRARRRAALAALLVTALISLLGWQNAPFARRLDNAVFDAFQRFAPRPYDRATPVRVVAIDRLALERYGQWPWPRPVLAALTDRLTEMGAKAIGFDMVFSEPDRTSPEEIARSLSRFGIAPAPAYPDGRTHDGIFAEALADTPSILGTILTRQHNDRRPVVTASMSILGTDPRGALPVFNGADINRAELGDAAAGVASVTLTPRDREDGIIRRVPLLARVGDRIVPTLALEILRVGEGQSGYLLRGSDANGEIAGLRRPAVIDLRVGPHVLKTTADGAMWIRYSGSRSGRALSAATVLDAAMDDAFVRGQIDGRFVLIGATAPGLGDIVATPMSATVPGVEVHAELLEQILGGTSLVRPDWASGAERLASWTIGLLIAGIVVLAAYGWAAFFASVALVSLPVFSFLAFSRHGVLIGPTIPVLATTGAWVSAATVDYLGARRERREIRRQFEHFVAPDVIEEIARDPNRHMSPGGEERDLSILFCDVRHFSSISAALQPSDLIDWLNGYLTPMTEAILAERGTIDKFIGDSIMAFWNAPRRDETHARGALRGALSLVKAAEAMSVGYTAKGFPPARIGVGLNTGPCSVGRIGARSRLDYTCIGDAVNVASRLDGMTKIYGLDICIGEETVRQAEGFAFIEIDRVEVLGRSGAAFDLYTVAGNEDLAATPAFRIAKTDWEGALAAYRAGDFDAARTAFSAIAARPSPVIDLGIAATAMLARIEDFDSKPLAADWDAVYRATHK